MIKTQAANANGFVFQILTENLVTRDVLPQALLSIQEVGVVKEEMDKTRRTLSELAVRLAGIEQEARSA